MRPRLTYANVTATLALIIAVGGASAFAATQLAKNSVGAKQLKKNAVTTAKIKNEAITAAKVKKGTLTGAQINAGTLGTVPKATTANTANTASTATTATTANSLASPEGWHEVGAPGEPVFQNGWENLGSPEHENAAFFKDHEGIVHLKGSVKPGGTSVIFQLPPGFRPASGKKIEVAATCSGGPCTEGVFPLTIFGPGFSPTVDGGVEAFVGGTFVNLDGVTFRAES
jgi:hypothetical protein